ncbi:MULTISPECIES: hypothetical protein [unclassified Pseudomonas]|uniref:hypothetical protein n=1 Tax=unclassified Pseudomonas TaxID=196821 RepID=UPI0035C06D55
MIGITSVSINGVSAQPSVSPPSTVQVQEGDARKREDGLKVDVSTLAENGEAKKTDQGGSGEPAHIKQLRELIKQLQKQLAEEQKQLAKLMASKMDEGSKLSLVSAKQASIATLNGQVQAATAQLLEALGKTGGSSAGGMVSTQA